MGHAIGGGFLNATTKDAALKEGYANAEEFAYINGDREEGSDSYHGNFKFYNKIFNTTDEADEFFYSLGSYCDGIVLVKELGNSAKNRYYTRKNKIEHKKLEFKNKVLNNFKERTSKSIGCKKCGNRLSKELAIKRNLICPNCYNWLVSDTIKSKYNKFNDQLENLEIQYNKDCAESGKPRFYAKYEIHY